MTYYLLIAVVLIAYLGLQLWAIRKRRLLIFRQSLRIGDPVTVKCAQGTYKARIMKRSTVTGTNSYSLMLIDDRKMIMVNTNSIYP